MNINIQKVVEIAESWEKKYIYTMPGCPNETCAYFVRHVFKTALHQLGILPVDDFRPYYAENNIKALPTGKLFADGLAGDRTGFRVGLNSIEAGDLLFFKDTFYSKQFPEGSITHVGIALDSKGLMADSSDGRCYVRNFHLTFPGKLVEVRRPHCLKKTIDGIGVTLNKGQLLKSGKFGEIKVKYGISKMEQIYGAKNIGYKPRVDSDGANFRFKFITVDIKDAGGKHVKLFHHDGVTSAFVGGKKASNLEIIAKFKGQLHVWVDGKEIKPKTVNIGVS